MVIYNQSISEVCLGESADAFFCTRYVCITIIAIFTGLLCIGKIAKYHYKKMKCPFQLSIFYCALGECICFVLHWTIWVYDLTENMGYWFRVIQLLIVCFLYSKLASRSLGLEEQYKRRYLPVLIVFSVYYFALIVWMFTVPRYKYPHKCLEFSHPCYTISDFILSQIFLVSGVLLMRKMSLVRMPSDLFLDQKKQLWSMIMAFEVEAIVSIVYDILLITVAAGPRGCGGFLYQRNVASALLFIVLRSLRLFVAIWFMLYMFDAQSTDYSEPPVYVYEEEDSLEAYMSGPHRPSIVPYARDSNYDVTEPLINETFSNYLPSDENMPFGTRTLQNLVLRGPAQ